MKEHKSYERLLGYISTGEENAISVGELSAICGCNPRDTKKEIQKARMENVLICSSKKGYFYPGNDNELTHFYKRYHSSALTTLTMIKNARAELIKRGINVKEV